MPAPVQVSLLFTTNAMTETSGFLNTKRQAEGKKRAS